MRRWMKLCDRNFVKQHNQLFDKYVTGPWWRILSEVRFHKCEREKVKLIKQAKKYKNYFVHYFGRQFNNLMKKGSDFRRSGHIDCYMLRAWYRFYSRVFNRELKQPRRRRQQKPHKFAYLTMKNSSFAHCAREFLIFWHFEDLRVLSTTWNDLFCSCVDDVSIWWQMFNFVFLCPKRWFERVSGMVFKTSE